MKKYFNEALKEGTKALGSTSPNPPVGAVIVSRGRIAGRGHTSPPGGPHAEIEALREAGTEALGGDLYVTLEPCSFYGRTPPCTEAIIKSGIRRVFIGVRDPNPRVSGNGIAELKKNEIEVIEITHGKLQESIRDSLRFYFKYLEEGRPYFTIKTAQTLDGKIAPPSGDSKWITGEESRSFVHTLRNRYDAILTGIGTVLKDDPLLTVRGIEKPNRPLRVILDKDSAIYPKSRIIETAPLFPTLIITGPGLEDKKIKQPGVEYAELPLYGPGKRFAWKEIADLLYRKEILSVFTEAGSAVNFSLLESGLADDIYLFTAPLLLGGESAFSSFGGRGFPAVPEARQVELKEIKRIGRDVLFYGRFRNSLL